MCDDVRKIFVTDCHASGDFEILCPNFWDLQTRLSSNTTVHPLYTKTTPQGTSLYIIAQKYDW